MIFAIHPAAPCTACTALCYSDANPSAQELHATLSTDFISGVPHISRDTAACWLRPEEPAEGATPIPGLERCLFHSAVLPEPASRSVLVCLPPQYADEPTRRFSVFYLHDGQNLFDPLTSYIPGHTWRANETADRLALAAEMEPVILVGIANTGLRRMAEYTPTRDWKLGGGEGPRYMRLIADELKPLVDATYRTLPDACNTAVGGSSLGGLISLTMGIERPEVFGKVAAVSPSIWWDQRSILNLVSRAKPKPDLRIWMDMGTAEGSRHVRDAAMLHRLLLHLGWREGIDLEYFIAENAVHDEDAWAARFDRVLRFLFPPRGQD